METNIVVTNRKARHEYHILETFDAGVELLGTEVKSLREGRANLQESYIHIRRGEVFLVGAHFSPYSHQGYVSHDPIRSRKLLLHAKEINSIQKQLDIKGRTAVPLKMYFNSRGWAKVQIGLAKGKKHYDKKAAKKELDIRRETDKEIKEQYK
ncbi:MAG: SsrA-binding protein SmpB [Candidatus Marinimicrobia bacterium]|jgi:SsrA-binding protein|nr:SsrA-binding protein SmpB [Candidatus Neomarinimicrobiota bacterium]MBT3617839.1 SsrA-binding protein SmpB [Candidatus Neomarinimicrobiota bacterium]MBT3828196.1 SsrA-binding protein SmpB [Candidatus Neomarinimicrobiota bacterium]MBT3997113.1 SsrA-binding protein SmpB [Candidatus Neomarinimicrobiota bacterium]MBT4280579.1 SsrA-binding protein SmpB [Candidatus Neomarinimicrobiota bacterium]